MEPPSKKLALYGSLVGLIGLICTIVSTALRYWFYASSDNVKFYFGLWEYCIDIHANVPGGKVMANGCRSWKKLTKELASLGGHVNITWLHACQVLMIIACVLMAIGVSAGFVFYFRSGLDRPIKRASGWLCVFAGVVVFIAVIIFATKYDQFKRDKSHVTVGHLHAGFILAGLSGSIAAVGGSTILANPTPYRSFYP